MSYPREDFTIEYADDGLRFKSLLDGPSRVYWSHSPDGFCDDNDLGELNGELVVADPSPERRAFFHIMTGDRYSVTCPRIMRAGGMMNLRDIGGYNALDGSAFVKYGRIFRSDMLCLCGEEELSRVEALRLKHIIDFRSKHDFKGDDSRVDPPIRGARHEYLPFFNDERLTLTFDETLKQSREKFIESFNAVFESYRTSPFGSKPMQAVMRYLLLGEAPLLYHCFAGKDRTGIMTAVILLVLGVPRDTIVFDYMLSAKARLPHYEKMCDAYREYLTDERSMEIMRFFALVNRDAIESSLNEIDSRYPDINDYFERELLLGGDDIARLRSLYLERH